MKFKIEYAGRRITVEIDERDREFDQFCVSVTLDERQRWAGWFTDFGPENPAAIEEEGACA